MEKKKCPLCEKEIDVRRLMIFNLGDEISKDINILSLKFLSYGICPICGYSVKTP